MNKRISKDFKLCDFKGNIIKNVSMKRYTTIQTGGNANFLCMPKDINDLIGLVKFCSKKRIPLLAIGRGSNIIVSDKGFKGVAIRLSYKFFKGISICRNNISVGAGVFLNDLCNKAENNSLSGCEFLVGIPATVGGTIIQNAGAHKQSISDILEEIKCVNKKGDIEIIKAKDIRFGYRESSLRKKIIVSAIFKLKYAKKADIKNKLNLYMEKRLKLQDYTKPSAGCFFKNPDNSLLSAGALIDKSALKGKRVGGAAVSSKHANFILNKGAATSKDIMKLADIIVKKVKQDFCITLKKEIELI